jgi:TM2 domain-containing membrane protein YozV
MSWFYMSAGQRYGPIAEAQLRELVMQGRVALGDLVWHEGLPGWTAAHEALAIALPPPPPAPPYPAAPPAYVVQPQQRERVAYVLLGVFLGLLGVHNFYAGYTGRAVAQLLVTLLVGWLVVPLLAVAIWNVVEVVTVTQDGKGVPFR